MNNLPCTGEPCVLQRLSRGTRGKRNTVLWLSILHHMFIDTIWFNPLITFWKACHWLHLVSSGSDNAMTHADCRRREALCLRPCCLFSGRSRIWKWNPFVSSRCSELSWSPQVANLDWHFSPSFKITSFSWSNKFVIIMRQKTVSTSLVENWYSFSFFKTFL